MKKIRKKNRKEINNYGLRVTIYVDQILQRLDVSYWRILSTFKYQTAHLLTDLLSIALSILNSRRAEM